MQKTRPLAQHGPWPDSMYGATHGRPGQQGNPTDLPLLTGTPFRCYPCLGSCRLAAAALHSARQGARRRPLARYAALGPTLMNETAQRLLAPARSLHSAGSNFKSALELGFANYGPWPDTALGPKHGPRPGAPDGHCALPKG